MKNDPYKKAGVDIKAGNDLVDKIKKDVAGTFDKNVLGEIGSFSGFYSFPKGFKNPVLVSDTRFLFFYFHIFFANTRHLICYCIFPECLVQSL